MSSTEEEKVRANFQKELDKLIKQYTIEAAVLIDRYNTSLEDLMYRFIGILGTETNAIIEMEQVGDMLRHLATVMQKQLSPGEYVF